ncbi:MAG: VWA domain-containing protein [Actinomycetota bacterium]|nr:VWA domain-containing protein [Actinomycetota bacterium]
MLGPEVFQPAPDQGIVRAAVALARALRADGLKASVDSEMVFYRALAEIDVRKQEHVYWAAKATFIHDPDERPTFDAIFERFWAGHALEVTARGSEHGESDPRMGGARQGGESLPQFRQGGKAAAPVDGQQNRATRDIPSADSEHGSSNEQRGVLAAYSPAESIGEKARLEYAREELVALHRLADAIKRNAPERRSRRLRPACRGSGLDVRDTLRNSLATDGEAFRLSYCGPTQRPRRLLFICDVSGSMERYSRVLLGSLKAALGASSNAEAFVFATRLTRLTRWLSGHDFERALERAREAVADWSGGTRIGGALGEFNKTFGRRGFARGAIVIVVSDGWDRGDPEILANEVARLQLQARRLVWINPRPMLVEDQPLAIGMRAAMPYVDDFVPGHDPRAIAGLGTLLADLGGGRPQRRRSPQTNNGFGSAGQAGGGRPHVV